MKKILVAAVLALFLGVALVASRTPARPVAAPPPEPGAVSLPDQDSEFLRALAEGNLDKVKAMVQARPAYANQRFLGKLAIVEAVTHSAWGFKPGEEERRFEIIRFLLESGADVNSRHKTGQTILCLAIQFSRKDNRLPLLLLAEGADPKLVGKPYGWENPEGSPLHAAAMRGDRELVDALLARGADINLVYGRQTPLQMAQRYRSKEMESYLRSRGAR